MIILRATRLFGAAMLLGNVAFGQSEPAAVRFEAPVAVRVDGQVLELSDRLAAPALGDFFGDGRKDLLIGQDRGRLRVLRNVGTDAQPEYAAPVWFDEIIANGKMPVG
ncbi:MAG: hypothetical protein ACKV0T_04335 [Planctomycetales bacterium]